MALCGSCFSDRCQGVRGTPQAGQTCHQREANGRNWVPLAGVHQGQILEEALWLHSDSHDGELWRFADCRSLGYKRCSLLHELVSFFKWKPNCLYKIWQNFSELIGSVTSSRATKITDKRSIKLDCSISMIYTSVKCYLLKIIHVT